MKVDLKEGQSVSYIQSTDKNESPLYIIKSIKNGQCLLYHPKTPSIFMQVEVECLRPNVGYIKGSLERALEFIENDLEKLDFYEVQDYVSLLTCFSVHRTFTKNQKRILYSICGKLAKIHFNEDLNKTMSFIVENNPLLDEFNTMWFNKFKKLFDKKIPVKGKRQKEAIFNMAGFLLAELKIPSIIKK